MVEARKLKTYSLGSERDFDLMIQFDRNAMTAIPDRIKELAIFTFNIGISNVQEMRIIYRKNQLYIKDSYRKSSIWEFIF